jgi:hypothetical protein
VTLCAAQAAYWFDPALHETEVEESVTITLKVHPEESVSMKLPSVRNASLVLVPEALSEKELNRLLPTHKSLSFQGLEAGPQGVMV